MTVFADSSRFIMDLGMNNGDDTAYYLAKGFDVVALEANPALVEAARTRFAKEIAAKRLSIVEAAVWSKAGTVPFYVNEVNNHRSSVNLNWASHDGTPAHAVEVTAVTLGDLFDRFGTPLYLKVDVQGVDEMVLKQLRSQIIKPLYVSVEDCRFGYEFIAALADAGYDGFKLVDQSQVSSMRDPKVAYRFSEGSSGPFGEALPGHWLDRKEFEKLYSHTVRDRAGTRVAPRTHWWDIHAVKL